MKLVFFGTPEFAVPTLKALHDSRHQITLVVTAADKKSGRGLEINKSAIKKTAEDLGYPILQPNKLDDTNFVNTIKQIQADIYVVVAFKILPEIILNNTTNGAINLHASLLPKYRGAAPVNHAILNGETETGLTTFIIKKKVDTGDILFQQRFLLNQDITAGEALEKLSQLGPELIIKSLDAIESGNINTIKQENEKASIAPKINPGDYAINWQTSAEKIHQLIRAFSPRPGAYTFYDGKRVKLFKSTLAAKPGCSKLSPGEIRYESPCIRVGTADNSINIYEIQMEGKKRLPVKEFILGYDKMKGSYFDKA